MAKYFSMETPYREIGNDVYTGQVDYRIVVRDDGMIEFGVDYTNDILTVKQAKELLGILQMAVKEAMKQ